MTTNRRYRRVAWYRFYNTKRWHKRRRYQLAIEPFCRPCAARNVSTPATIADHVTPHDGDWTLFITGELQSLCKACHDADKRYEELHGFARDVGLDGVPLDRRHHCHRD